MPTDPLKPCPFCGSISSEPKRTAHGTYWRECSDCLADGPTASTEAEAAALWNKREPQREV